MNILDSDGFENYAQAHNVWPMLYKVLEAELQSFVLCSKIKKQYDSIS